MSGPTSVDVSHETQVDRAIKTKIHSFELPEELLCKILSFLDYKNLDVCRLVCRQWRRVADDEEVRVESYLKTRIFGGAQWAAHYGNIGEKTPLPQDIGPFLKGPSPFWPDTRVAASTRLVWMPKAVNGVPFTLDTLSKLIQHPLKGPVTRFRFYSEAVQTKHGTSTRASGCWVAITNTVIPGSRGQSHAKQQKLVKQHAGYAIPGALDAATWMVAAFVMSGTYLYGQNPWTYTRCNEKILSRHFVAIGCFGANGLSVDYDAEGDDEYCGVGALWKFSS